ncbi:MAG: 3-methyl-2-oxobutanoate hydroxymethyltransferase [Ignavibacteria bacterium RIFOXYB2_FULL_36_7]|nr:MAG: 3-methyl-2-oxobutanoate hydroxymethyltransferase [Bdellovibrionales bacterium RIFOXYA1_FULL_38_20]OFZ48493.1 MAG: 3-methyl-2-oxobutanoate hydroxymethyltransferase [Bdellovibrionales bacterium RIFOXYC1_FULL_37_79]OFZ57172.1 MAG: 3-methyl-2-oxobutanoate hydroxymethyltransferase [Bdellovibrionales bacterium RIFOXYB1_FULL_37_110]OFZ63151.1 MAG: 3-methyl-2-oxobutanoate hydroxymethyltransferase [Bdellovibrionales bacterium RIFOXYD1_FULL_36_51]OGV05164.1 MAG: 3-methyl-2-oxobutanoate hydroxymet
MFTVNDFLQSKLSKQKISMVTAYDYTTAKIINQSSVDSILVGDSVSMVVHGFESTLNATVEMMKMHVAAVKRGAPSKFIIADMPFLSFRKGISVAMEAVEQLMQSGGCAVKIEGVRGHEEIIKHIVQSGVPVVGHLGLTPQSVHSLSGYKVQGKSKSSYEQILEDAGTLEVLGVFALVLECVPECLGQEVTSLLKIPTIGIGAGSQVDGQVLVIQDLLGMSSGPYPKFVRQYLHGFDLTQKALDQFHVEVTQGSFPNKNESYIYE